MPFQAGSVSYNSAWLNCVPRADEPSAIGVGSPRGTEMAKDVVSEVIAQ